MLRRARFNMRLHVVCPFVCLSVTFRYRDHIGWNTSKIISPPNSLRLMRLLTPTWAIWFNGNTPKLGWNRGGTRSTKNVQNLRNGARYEQGYYYGLIGSYIRALDWHQIQWPWMTLNGRNFTFATRQEAQLLHRNSASAAHVYLGWL